MERHTTKHPDYNEKETDYERLLWKWGKYILLLWGGYILILQLLAPWAKAILFPEFWTKDGGFDYGTFGDTFGALNALFAGLAFAGIIVTIRQQAKALRATREEMRNTNCEFSRQTLEVSLFEYINYMHKVRPEHHEKQVSLILKSVEEFVALCKKYHSRKPYFFYWRSLKRKINIIRKELKEFSTWRRTFSDWCEKVEDESHRARRDEKPNEFIEKYEERLWNLLSQHERRVLFLQCAFYTQEQENHWNYHRQFAEKRKCLKRYADHFDKKSYNALLELLHLSGPYPNYPIRKVKKIKNIMKKIYDKNICRYELPE